LSLQSELLCPAIDNPASREIRAVIRFLHAKNMSVAEIRSELCIFYGQNVVNEASVSTVVVSCYRKSHDSHHGS
jgi:hypothetical protein